MKKLAVLLALLVFAAQGFAQTPEAGPAQGPVQLAQAGSAASGASPPATSAGATSAVVAVIAAAAAGVAAVVGYNSTTTSHNH